VIETLKKWLRQLRGKDLPIAVVTEKGEPVVVITTRELAEKAREKVRRDVTIGHDMLTGATTIRVPRPGSKVRGYGRKMKHSTHQSKEYRKSVKAKVQPEEEEKKRRRR